MSRRRIRKKAGFSDINQQPQAVCSLKEVFLDYSLRVDFLLRPNCFLRAFLGKKNTPYYHGTGRDGKRHAGKRSGDKAGTHSASG
jgi:hypothetical protein